MATPQRKSVRRAFTLIELMVSIAMVLVIILGVNAIFKMASDTVNAGQALAVANRENRGVQSVLYDDIRPAVIDRRADAADPHRSGSASFRNRPDELSDRDYDPPAPERRTCRSGTTDLDANNVEGEASVRGELTPQLIYNTRNHRIDRMAFFGTNLYRRQTGTRAAHVPRRGDELRGVHWYGHLDQPNNIVVSQFPPGGDMSPGERPTAAGGNPNNLYATDWILGRSVTLLKEAPTAPLAPNDPAAPNYIVYPIPPDTFPFSPVSVR